MSDEPCDDRPAIGKAAEPANAAADGVAANGMGADGAAAESIGADEAAPPVSLLPVGEQLSEPASLPPAFAPSRLLAVALTFAGIILPATCFAIGFPDQPYWQSGTWNAYAQLLLSRKNAIPLYPLLLYAMTCLGLVVWRPARWGQRPWVRWGIYSGVVLAAECWLVFMVAISELETVVFMIIVFASALVPLVGWLVGRAIVYLWNQLNAWWMIPGGILLLIFGWGMMDIVIASCVACATTWALATYIYVARALARGPSAEPLRFSLAQLFALVGTLAANFAAWRISFATMLDEYSRLPKTEPAHCFVCTAAAAGHPGVVHSQSWQAADGRVIRVNDQLRYLKAFELLWASLSPAGHRRLRRIYDRIGPRVAALLCRPLLADCGYWLLKPLEWFARACLAVAVPGHARVIGRLYRPVGGRASDGQCQQARG